MRFELIENIIIRVNKIVKGSLTINSKIERNDCCISRISDETRAIRSPFFFSEKKLTGRETIF